MTKKCHKLARCKNLPTYFHMFVSTATSHINLLHHQTLFCHHNNSTDALVKDSSSTEVEVEKESVCGWVLYIYIYIKREREREKEREMCPSSMDGLIGQTANCRSSSHDRFPAGPTICVDQDSGGSFM
jgi:hypothetical protein